MPGLRMGQMLRVDQQLEQRLEQKQRLTLRLSQAMIQTFHTSGEDDTVEQGTLLESMLKDVNIGVYPDWQNFAERCMKRVPKEKRTHSARSLIKDLRTIANAVQPGLGDLKLLLNLGLYAQKNHEVPTVMYAHFADTLQTTAGQKLENRMQLLKIGDALQTNSGNLTSGYEFLHRSAEHPVYAPYFDRIISRAATLASDKADVLRFTNLHFDKVAAGLADIQATHIDAGFDYVEQLYHLSKDHVEKRYFNDAQDLLTNKDFVGLRDRYSHVPLPILANLVKYFSRELLEKVDMVFSQEYLKEGTDAKRRIFRSIYALETNPQKKKVLEHVFSTFTSGEHVSKILAHVELLQESGNFTYYFDETDGKKMVSRLGNYLITANLNQLGLSEAYKQKIADNPNRLLEHNLMTMVSVYGSVLSSSFPEGLPLLREIVEHIVDGDFATWRYGHEKAGKQMSMLAHATLAWQENARSERLIGDINKLQPQIRALQIIAEDLKTHYTEEIGLYGCGTLNEVLPFLRGKVEQIDAQFRSGPVQDHKTLGEQKRRLATDYTLLQTIMALEEPTQDTLTGLVDHVRTAVRLSRTPEMKVSFEEAKKVLESQEIKNMEKVTVLETDAPARIFNVGKTPVQSCQRWNEKTSYNKCLMAYVADANKKLYQVLDAQGDVIIRSVVRLMPFDKESPMLLVERPYASRWTADYGRALIAQVAQRALEINQSLYEPVAVATNDPRIEAVLQDFVKQYGAKLYTKNFVKQLPPSKNAFEYSDSFGGCLASGTSIQGKISYVLIALGTGNAKE